MLRSLHWQLLTLRRPLQSQIRKTAVFRRPFFMNIDEPVWECFAPLREGYSVPSGTGHFWPRPQKCPVAVLKISTLPYGKRLKF